MQTSPPIEPRPVLLTADEAAAQLRRSRFWVERAGRDKVIARVLSGNQYLYPQDGIDAYVKANYEPAVTRPGQTSRSAARARSRGAA